MSKHLLSLCAAAIVVSACGEITTDPVADASMSPSFARMGKVAICHLDADVGGYFEITISGNAEAAHRAHGDGQRGEAVPAQSGYVFDQGCALIERSLLPVGSITADILRGGNPPGTNRGVESSAVNLVADAQLWATAGSGAQMAFMNPGGVRSDLLFAQSGSEGDGVVTYGETFIFQPFGNRLLTLPMTGAQIIAVLENQCQPAGSGRPILLLGVSDGFTYDVSTTIVGSDCTSITIGNVRLHGVPLDPGATYQVTANSFLAGGGDNFDAFTATPGPSIDGGNDLDAMLNYFAAFSPIAPPATSRINEL
jgi:5'-nucleotidase